MHYSGSDGYDIPGRAYRDAYGGDAGMYRDPSRYAGRGGGGGRRGRFLAFVVAGAVAAGAVAAAAWALAGPHPFDVVVNGQAVTVEPGATVADIVEQGAASPAAGALLAIDGETIDPSGGDPFEAEVDGAPASGTTELHEGAEVSIADGDDVTEESTEEEIPIPHGTSESDRGPSSYWTGSLHVLSKGSDGLRKVRTGSVSGKTVEETVSEPVDDGYHILTASPERKAVALTFDDGPWPGTTSEILDILEENGAKATFFTIGNQVGEHADDVRRASAMGCEICTHTWDHASGSGGGVNLTRMSPQEQIDEVERGYAAIEDVLGERPPKIMRAPGGNFHGDIVSNLWNHVDAEIGWDVDTEDWRKPGADVIASRILGVEPGGVVLMHDGGGDRSQTVEALRIALPQLRERGYEFVTVSEMLELAGQKTSEAAR